jgi:hypothetical protein
MPIYGLLLPKNAILWLIDWRGGVVGDRAKVLIFSALAV